MSLSPKRQYVEDALKEIRERWFKDHIAEVSRFSTEDDLGDIIRLRWRRPDSGNYAVTYLLYRNSLMVLGDLGAGTYVWSSTVDLAFLAGCDYNYMLGKLESVERGRPLGEDWDPDVAQKTLRDEFMERARETFLDRAAQEGEDNPEKGWTDLVECNLVGVRFEDELRRVGLDNDYTSYINDREEWGRYLYERDRGHDLNEWLGNIGIVPSMRVLAHNLGLKMAYKQLQVRQKEAA